MQNLFSHWIWTPISIFLGTIALIVAIFPTIKSSWRKRKITKTPQNIADYNQWIRLRAEKELKPGLVKSSMKKMRNRRINWPVSFNSISKSNDDDASIVQVQFLYSSVQGRRSVIIKMDESKIPEYLHEEARREGKGLLRLKGRIAEVHDSGGIYLKDDTKIICYEELKFQ